MATNSVLLLNDTNISFGLSSKFITVVITLIINKPHLITFKFEQKKKQGWKIIIKHNSK